MECIVYNKRGGSLNKTFALRYDDSVDRSLKLWFMEQKCYGEESKIFVGNYNIGGSIRQWFGVSANYGY